MSSRMKKRKSIVRYRPSTSVEHRLTKLEGSVRTIWTEIKEINLNVTNHIPTSIADVKRDLQILLNRKLANEAIRNFCNNFLKLSLSLASLGWLFIQISKAVK